MREWVRPARKHENATAVNISLDAFLVLDPGITDISPTSGEPAVTPARHTKTGNLHTSTGVSAAMDMALKGNRAAAENTEQIEIDETIAELAQAIADFKASLRERLPAVRN